MSELIRNAVSSGLRDPTAPATASIEHRGERGGVRATLDLPRGVHRANSLNHRQNPSSTSRAYVNTPNVSQVGYVNAG
jgi:hypothetical protein